jgi:microcystin-dependent protein
MSNPPNGYNTDASFNKFKGTYYNDDIDVSGGDIISRSGNLYLAPNSSIYTSANQIQFNEEFQFTDFIDNVNVLGQLKNTYNSVSYDVGLQCEKTDEAVANIATLSPIVSDTQFKLTGLYWDAGLSSTVFTNNVSFPNSSISSLAINNSSFVSLSGAQSIDGSKTFNTAPTMSGANISVGSIPINRVSGTAVNTNGAQNITAIKTFTVAQTFQNNIRLDGSLLLSAGTITLSNADLQKISLLNTATGNIQTQIDNIGGVSLSASNIFTALNRFSNSIRLDGSLIVNNNTTTLTNDNLNRIQWLSGVSSSVSTSITNLNTSVSTLNTKTTKMSYMSIAGINTTTILDSLISQTFSFTNTINNISTTVFGYLSGLTENIKTSLDNLSARITTVEIVGTIIMSPLLDLQTTTSNKYLMCNGQAVSRTTYSALFAKFGELFGVGNGSTTFNLPNYNGMFLRGMGNQIINGVNYGNYNSTYAPDPDSIQNHTHSGQAGAYLGTNNTLQSVGYMASLNYAPASYSFTNTGNMSTGRINDFETKPVSIGIYYYVRT